MISLIVAHDNNRVIGRKGNMPWGMSLKADLRWFREHTLNKTVIMGSKTFESIGKPLQERTNIILTKDRDKNLKYTALGCHVFSSIEELVEKYQYSQEEAFVIGGGIIYEQFIPYSNRLYITQIDSSFEGDSFFPEYDIGMYKLIYKSYVKEVFSTNFLIYQKGN